MARAQLTSPPRVVVARYIPQHSLRLAAALQKAGLLTDYYTGLYLSWQHPPFSYFRWLPESFRSSIDARLFARAQRQHPELDPKRVKVLRVYANMTMALLLRGGVRQPWELPYFRRQFVRFECEVADEACQKADIIVLYDTHAYHALVRTKQTSLIRVLDMATVHWKTRDSLLRAEAQRWPAYRNQISLPSSDADRFAQLVAEPCLADYLLVGSEWVKATCIDNGCDPDRVYVVPYGVDTELFHPTTEQRAESYPFRILYVGSNTPVKGFHYLVSLLGRTRDLDIEVWCCGLQEGDRDLFGEIAANGKVKALGYQTQTQVANLMRQADLLVHPSVLDSFSLACLEAMASGLPVLTTPRSGVAWGAAPVVRNEENGFVVPHGDVEAMESVVRMLYGAPDMRHRIGHRARETAEQHTWEAYEKGVAQVFSDIVRQGKPDS